MCSLLLMTRVRGFIIISVRQGLLLRLPFADNGVLSGRRPFLLIEEEGNYIKLLNVSSTKGKEHKLLYDSNVEIEKYNPPFRVSSYIKLDAIYKVEKCQELFDCILCQGQRLEENEFKRLFQLYKRYKKENNILVTETSSSELRRYLSQ